MKIICRQCGKEKDIYPSYAKRRNNSFCSKECFYEFKKTQPKKTKKTTICQNCNNEFAIKQKYQKFCSNKCKGEFNRLNNIIKINNDYSEILIKSKNEILKCLIDNEDINIVNNYRIMANYTKCTNSYYAIAVARVENGQKRIGLHRLLTNCPDGLVVDHINHNTLDNRKKNLRVCTYKENSNNMTEQSKINIKNGVKKRNNKKEMDINTMNEILNMLKDGSKIIYIAKKYGYCRNRIAKLKKYI